MRCKNPGVHEALSGTMLDEVQMLMLNVAWSLHVPTPGLLMWLQRWALAFKRGSTASHWSVECHVARHDVHAFHHRLQLSANLRLPHHLGLTETYSTSATAAAQKSQKSLRTCSGAPQVELYCGHAASSKRSMMKHDLTRLESWLAHHISHDCRQARPQEILD